MVDTIIEAWWQASANMRTAEASQALMVDTKHWGVMTSITEYAASQALMVDTKHWGVMASISEYAVGKARDVINAK